MVEIAGTGIFVYCATFSFALSALSSDLLFIRFCLTLGFLFLVLNSLHLYASHGSYLTFPMTANTKFIDIPLLINYDAMCFEFIHLYSSCPWRTSSETLRSHRKGIVSILSITLWGLTPLQFQHILKHGGFVEYPPHHEIPACQTTLYLVLEGKVECRAKYNKQIFGRAFIKRSGEFFDIKLFNFFYPLVSTTPSSTPKRWHERNCLPGPRKG